MEQDNEGISFKDENHHVFSCNCLDVHDFSQDARDKIAGIIDGNEGFEDSSDVHENVMFYSTRYLMEAFSSEKDLLQV